MKKGYLVPLVGLLLLLILLLSSCSFPGVTSPSAQLPIVNTTPQAQTLPPIRFPQDEAAHRDLTEWWYYTGHLNAVSLDGQPHHYGLPLAEPSTTVSGSRQRSAAVLQRNDRAILISAIPQMAQNSC